jgi:hypothetical protein
MVHPRHDRDRLNRRRERNDFSLRTGGEEDQCEEIEKKHKRQHRAFSSPDLVYFEKFAP